MPNSYYNHTTFPATSSAGSSALARAEFDAITAGFALLPAVTGNANKLVTIDPTGTSLSTSNVATVSSTGLALGGSGAIVTLPRFSDATATLLMGGRAGTALSLFNNSGVTSEITVDTAAIKFLTASVQRLQIDSTAVAITGAATVSTTLGVTGLITATGGVTGNVTGNASGNLLLTGGALTGALTVTGASVGPLIVTNTTVAGYTEFSVNSNDRAFVVGQRSSTNVGGDLAYLYSATATPIAFFTSAAERMRIDAAGNVGIGKVPLSLLDIRGPVATFADLASTMRIETDAVGTDTAGAIGAGITFAQRWQPASGPIGVGMITGVKTSGAGNYGGGLAFWSRPNGAANHAEAMRIDGAGNVGIGGVPGTKLHVQGAGTNPLIRISETTGYALFHGLTASGSSYLGTDSAAGSVSGTSNATLVWNQTATPILFGTNSGERMRIDINGNVGISVSAFGTGAAKVLGLANATAPTTSPVGMGQLYVEAGALKYRGSSGTVTVVGVA